MAVSITAFVNFTMFSTISSEKNNWNASKGVLTYFAAALEPGFLLKIFATVLFSKFLSVTFCQVIFTVFLASLYLYEESD